MSTTLVSGNINGDSIKDWFVAIPAFLLRPVTLIRGYERSNIGPDLIAGLTIAIILLPQGLAYAIVAELPPQMGLYAAILASAAGALWGSSSHLQAGPTNPSALLVLSVLITVAMPGTAEYLVAASVMAVMVGLAKLAMGLARLGVLVNFVSDAVITGFTAGAGILIAVNQLRHLMGVSVATTPLVYQTLYETVLQVSNISTLSLAIGGASLLVILLARRFIPKLSGALIAAVLATSAAYFFGLPEMGVAVVGELPRSLPPLAPLSFDLGLIGKLSNGALAAAAIGLVEAAAISRSIGARSGERLDSNQEFVGQGMASIAAGVFSGYTVSGSYTRSAVAYDSGGKSFMTHVMASLFVLVFTLLIAPMTGFLPTPTVAAIVIVSAFGLFNIEDIRKTFRASVGDAVIMVVTFAATMLLELQFAIMVGVLASFAYFLLRTSTPIVKAEVPDPTFRHFLREEETQDACPQCGIISVEGPLYFGAVNYVEDYVRGYASEHPEQRFLMLRLNTVDQMDISGIHMLESIANLYRRKGGDIYLAGVRPQVREVIESSGLSDDLGKNHLLARADAINTLFHSVFSPSVCIYECERRVFAECQALPKHNYIKEPTGYWQVKRAVEIDEWLPETVATSLESDKSAVLVDVREPAEFEQGHIRGAVLVPLRLLVEESSNAIPKDRPVYVVCRSGRRSTHAIGILHQQGYRSLRHVKGGMLAWEAAGLPMAIEVA